MDAQMPTSVLENTPRALRAHHRSHARQSPGDFRTAHTHQSVLEIVSELRLVDAHLDYHLSKGNRASVEDAPRMQAGTDAPWTLQAAISDRSFHRRVFWFLRERRRVHER